MARGITIFIIIMLMFYNGRALGNEGEQYSLLMGIHIGNKLTPNKEYIAVVNWDINPNYPRFFIISLKSKQIVHAEYTSHGINTGPTHSAKDFSNTKGSRKSSLGIFKVAETYYGKYGYSVKLDGLTKGVNDNVRKRYIVLHPSHYVSDKYMNKNKYPGRSFGCLTLDPNRSIMIINKLKNGSLIINIHKGKVKT